MELLRELLAILSVIALISTIGFICMFPIEYKDAIMFRHIDSITDKIFTLGLYVYLVLSLVFMYVVGFNNHCII